MRPLVLLCIAVLSVACAAEPPATEPVARGRQLYQPLDCGSCHESRFGGLLPRSAPPLDHIGTVAETRQPGTSAADYLRESIASPGAYIVPGYRDTMPRGLAQRLSPDDVDALVAYLLSLR